LLVRGYPLYRVDSSQRVKPQEYWGLMLYTFNVNKDSVTFPLDFYMGK